MIGLFRGPAARVLLPSALLLAACAAPRAAEPSPFRTALAQAGGCGHHRTLIEARLGPLDGARPAAPTDQADLFGKLAGRWSEAEIRDALAAFATCEAAPGAVSANERLARERLTRDLRRLDAALRRAIVAGLTQGPRVAEPERPPHGLGRGGPPAGMAAAPVAAPPASPPQAPPSGTGRLRQGPAFVPAARAPIGTRTASASDVPANFPSDPLGRPDDFPVPGSAPVPPSPATASPGPEPAAATVTEPLRPETALARTWTAGARGSVPATEARSATTPLAAHSPPAERPHCALSLGLFDLLQAEMRLAEVEGLIGCRGHFDGTATIPGLGAFDTYVWSERGVTLTLVFQNKRLKSKVQRGLPSDTGRGG